LWTDPGNIKIAHRHMDVEIGAEAAQFPEKEYINGIAVAVCVTGMTAKGLRQFFLNNPHVNNKKIGLCSIKKP
jgi:hypothetical protein